MAAGIAHLVAAAGLVRARRWAASLTGYLAAAGVGASVFAILMMARAEVDMFGAGGATTAAFFAFMIAWLLVGDAVRAPGLRPGPPAGPGRHGRAAPVGQAGDGSRATSSVPSGQVTFA